MNWRLTADDLELLTSLGIAPPAAAPPRLPASHSLAGRAKLAKLMANPSPFAAGRVEQFKRTTYWAVRESPWGSRGYRFRGFKSGEVPDVGDQILYAWQGDHRGDGYDVGRVVRIISSGGVHIATHDDPSSRAFSRIAAAKLRRGRVAIIGVIHGTLEIGDYSKFHEEMTRESRE